MPLAPAAVSFFYRTNMSPGFLYLSDSFHAVLKPCIPPPIMTTFAFVGNDILKPYFLHSRINIIIFRTKKYIYKIYTLNLT